MSRYLSRAAGVAALTTAAVALSGCWSHDRDDNGLAGTPVAGGARSFAASGFDDIVLAGADNIIVRHGEAFSVLASGPAATLDQLVIRVRGHSLDVRRRHGSGTLSPATVTVTLPALKELTLAGSGVVTADRLGGDHAEITIAGSGRARIAAIAANRLDITVAGSGTLDASGRADRIDANIAGSGSINAPALIGGRADITVAGSGNVALAVAGPADVTMMGSGNVTLTGGARCTANKMGSGDVTCS